MEFDEIDNFNNLFQKGILLNEQYNNLKEIIDNLIQFSDKGIH